MLAYFNQSPYAKVHGLEGEEALIAQTKKPQRTPVRLRFFVSTLRKIFCVNHMSN